MSGINKKDNIETILINKTPIFTVLKKMHNSRIIRKFERFLFKGISEQPEPTWERNDNTNVEMRKTGKAQSISVDKSEENDFQIIGEFIYDFEAQKEIYTSKI